MHMNGYIRKYGNLSFEEKPFTNIDAMILTIAAYSNLEVVAPSLFDVKSKPVLLKDIIEFDLSILTAGRTFYHQNKKLFKLAKNSKRYGDIGICNILKIHDKVLSNQFYAATYIIPDVGTFIAYRGTDTSMVGWKEDLLLGINKCMPSQMDALDYLHNVAEKTTGPILIGGHSKGGNLAMFAPLFTEPKIRHRIAHIYNLDGVGFVRKDVFECEAYEELKDKIDFITPRDCIVGQILNNPMTPIIVKSNVLSVFQHLPHHWRVCRKTGELIRAKEYTKSTRYRHILIMDLVNNGDKKELTLVMNFIISSFGGTDSTIWHFLFSFKKIGAIHKAWKSFSKEDQVILKKALKNFKATYKRSKKLYKNGNKH